jgi:chromosomal replication initiation ATPase DnaA
MTQVVGSVIATKSEIDFLLEFLQNHFHIEEAITLHKKVETVKKISLSDGYTYESFLDAVCYLRGVTRKELQGKSRIRNLTDLRAAVSTVARDYFPELKDKEIGWLFTRRDRCTVLHHWSNVETVLQIQSVYLELKKQLKAYKNYD